MSRVGKKIINIPESVTLQIENDRINVKGPLGSNSIPVLNGMELKIDNNMLSVQKSGDDNDNKLSALHGLLRALLNNLIIGVTKGFKKELEIIGVGYKALQKNKNVEFSLGYSHSIVFTPPEEVEVKVMEPTKLEVFGMDKQKVGQVAANIRSLRPPEPYKGKGIRYKNEYIRRKAGKAGKA